MEDSAHPISDTGGISAAFTEIPPPNGETFLGHPAGRVFDGRHIIDFIAEKLKLSYLTAYLDSVGTNFRQGASFATGGRPPGYSPFNLGIQISQFIQFKARSTALYNQLSLNSFADPVNFCCGSFYGYHINCGKKAIVNGTVYGNPCNHPSRHISWDGIHHSQAANMWVQDLILNGSFSDPPVPIRDACHHQRNM